MNITLILVLLGVLVIFLYGMQMMMKELGSLQASYEESLKSLHLTGFWVSVFKKLL